MGNASLDIDHYQHIYTEYAPMLMRFAEKFVSGFFAEDIVHDVFLKLWDKQVFRLPESDLKRVLYVSVRNACLDYLRRMNMEQEIIDHRALQLKLDELDFFEASDELFMRKDLLDLLMKKVAELNSFDKEMVENYFSDLVNGIQTDEALDDWKLTVVLYIGTYLGANHISIRKHGITDTATKEKVLTIGIPLPCSKTVRWGVKKKERFTGKIPDENYRRNNRLLPVYFAKYDTMGTYIEDNIRIALLNLFEVGFTLKGYKVKKR